MTKKDLEVIGKKMYECLDNSKYHFFKQSDGEDGEAVLWEHLTYEKDMWIEMADLAVTAFERFEEEHEEHEEKNG